MKAWAAVAAAYRLGQSGAAALEAALSGQTKTPVVWLQGAGCNGDSVSLLNTMYYMTADQLLLNTVELNYHPTVMAAAGDLAVSAAEAREAAGGYVLVVEGAVPTGSSGRFCRIWEGMTMQDAVIKYSANAAFVLAVGACATYGGIPGGAPNPTGAKGVSAVLGNSSKIVNIPGCPAHPDWIVGTIAYIQTHGQAPPLDADRRPTMFFGKRIHDYCHERHTHCGGSKAAAALGSRGCMEGFGCKGPKTYADCYMRKFNNAAAGEFGVNWCIGSRSPCIGCVQPDFPDGLAPFFI
jgi:hydrogenase small subunit